jgi:hypothetical protein
MWQPIETAPKDEVLILYFKPIEGDYPQWRVTVDLYPARYPGRRQPTHWMPLPPPPAGTP